MSFFDLFRRNGTNEPAIENPILTKDNATKDVGQVGLRNWSGDIRETPESLKLGDLHARTRILKEMSIDPTIGGALQTFTNICLSCRWQVQEADIPFVEDDPEYAKAKAKAEADAQFLQECVEDLPVPFDDTVADVLGMLTYGFQIIIPQYKVRAGDSEIPKFRSKYNDKKFGWRYMKPIAPDSVFKWVTEEAGQGYEGLTGIHQQTVTGYHAEIPRNRMLLFRTTSKLDNPEGESILLSAINTWRDKENLINMELVGIERNLEGIPVAYIPPEYMGEDATPDQRAMADYIIKAVANLKFNRQTGLVLPSTRDDQGHRLIDIELMGPSGNTRTDAARTAVEAKELLLAESVMAQFMKLVNEGSNALSTDQTEMFVKALKGYMDRTKDVFNNEAVPELFRLNGDKSNNYPKLIYTGLEKKNITNIVNAITQASATGMIVPTKALQSKLLDLLGMPTTGADEEWDKITKLQDDLRDKLKEEPSDTAGTPEAL
mgnify:CR=1 FL=1